MAAEIQIQRRELTDEELRRQITALEQKHGMTSAEFLLRYNTGQLGDDAQFIRWAGLLWVASEAGLRFNRPSSARA
jgi:hypothetical protein